MAEYTDEEILSALGKSPSSSGYSDEEVLAALGKTPKLTVDFGKALRTPAPNQFKGEMLVPKRDNRPINPSEAVLSSGGPLETPLSGEAQGFVPDVKRLGQSVIKSGSRVLGMAGRMLEQDTEKVDPYDVGVFGLGVEGEWQPDEMGNINFVKTADPEKIREEQRNKPTAKLGKWLQEVDDAVKSPVYQEGSKMKIAGAVIENAPQSLMYMLPNLLPAGGGMSNALMYQDSYLSKLKELRKAKEEGRLQLNEDSIQKEAAKSALAEVIPEAAGNAAEAAVIKSAESFAKNFIPMGNAATIAGRFLNKVRGTQSGATLFSDVIAPSATKRIGRTLSATAMGMPIEGATEAATQWYQTNQDIDLGLAKIPVGTTRSDYVKQQMKEAAEVGAWSGAVMTGIPTAVGEAKGKARATDLQTALFAPVDTSAPDFSERVKERQKAAQGLIGVISASEIPSEEKTNATVNIITALMTNKSIPYSSTMFEDGAIDLTPTAPQQASPVAKEAQAAQDASIPIPEVGIGQELKPEDISADLDAVIGSVSTEVDKAGKQADINAPLDQKALFNQLFPNHELAVAPESPPLSVEQANAPSQVQVAPSNSVPVQEQQKNQGVTNAEQITTTAPVDGSSSTQQGLRQEGGHTAVSGQGVLEGGQSQGLNTNSERITDGNVPVRQEGSQGQAEMPNVRNQNVEEPEAQYTHIEADKSGQWFRANATAPVSEAVKHVSERVKVLESLLKCVGGK